MTSLHHEHEQVETHEHAAVTWHRHEGVSHNHPPHAAHHAMTFHLSTDCVLLFDWWHPTTTLQFTLSLVAIFCLCIFSEWLSAYSHRINLPSSCSHFSERIQLVKPSSSFVSRPEPALSAFASIRPLALTAASLGLSYGLMLLTMTFNAGIFCTVVIGISMGRVFFRSQQLSPPGASWPSTELCH